VRSPRLRIVGVASIAFAGLLVAALAVTPTPAGAAGTTSVRVAQPLCKAATAGHAACDSLRLVTRQVSTSRAAVLEQKGVARSAKSSRLGFGPAGGYTPTQLAKAYGINPKARTTQTVAIVDAFDNPSVRADLNAFDSQYGIPHETATSFRVLNQDGHATPLPAPDEGWAGEITLDVQSVRAVCRSCRIVLVEANDNNDDNLAAAVNQAVAQGAHIVSNSYGGPESPADPAALVKAYNHKGVAIMASTGDDGWYDWDNANSGVPSDNQAQVPAGYNTVVGVGGTSLYLNPDGSRASEDVWNDNGPGDLYGSADVASLGFEAGAAGSGCSNLYDAQRWQQKVAGYRSLGCGSTKRNGVDIAALADEFTGFDTFETFDWCTNPDTNVCPLTAADDGWATFGGTSLASPLVAGMWGLAGGPRGVKYPALTLYGHFQKSKASTYDVRVGGTGGCDTQSPTSCGGLLQNLIYGSASGLNPNTGPGGLLDCAWGATGDAPLANRAQCYAQPGYDGVSGVGTPKGLSVFKSIGPTPKISATAGVQAHHGHTFSAAQSSDPFPGGGLTSYVWHWGDGSATATSHATASHMYKSAGQHSVTLTVTDSYGQSGTTHTKVAVH
jgi:hypothetical protein